MPSRIASTLSDPEGCKLTIVPEGDRQHTEDQCGLS